MLLRTPFTFKGITESLLECAFLKSRHIKLLNERNEVLILIDILVEVVFLVKLLVNLLGIQVPIFSKQLV